MKPWQKGYELHVLSELSNPFLFHFQTFSHGAFGIPKERDIATALEEKRIAWSRNEIGEIDGVAIFRIARQRSSQKDFAQRSIRIEPGDLQVQAIAGTRLGMSKVLGRFILTAPHTPIWVEIFQEYPEALSLVEAAGGKLAATKISASSDIKGLYLIGEDPKSRVAYALEESETAGLVELNPRFIDDQELERIKGELGLFKGWAQHYSGYNKRSSWTAFALRGFDPADPSFIIKPAEMSKKWKAENADRCGSACDRTVAADEFPSAMSIIERIPAQTERVRMMRLAPDGGELSRHADITDRNAGTADGRIARLHIPIATNELCRFSSWDLQGKERSAHVPVGSLWYLDVRKPHAVRNPAMSERVHFVIDVVSNEKIRQWITAAERSAR